jgi:hypothetical protein
VPTGTILALYTWTSLIARAGGAARGTAMTARSGALLTVAAVGVVKPPRRASKGVREAGIRVPTEAGAVEGRPSLAQKIWGKSRRH